MVKIIAATPEHSTAIAAIWNPIIRDTFATFNSVTKSQSEIADLIRQRPAFILAETEGKIAGFATFCQFRSGVGYAHSVEHTVMIDPKFQGNNFGKMLMNEIIKSAISAQHHVMMAGICALNHAGLAFHSTIGFEKVGYLHQVGRKNDRWLDLVLMQKLL